MKLIQTLVWGPSSQPLHRRLIPFAIAGIVAVALPIPSLVGWVTEEQANQWTAAIATIGFAVKALVFAVMRHRMVYSKKRLTVFGTALVDFFLGLVIMDLVLAVTFGIALAFALRGVLVTPLSFRIGSRAAIAGGITLTVGTAIASLYELVKAAAKLSVHERQDDLSPPA